MNSIETTNQKPIVHTLKITYTHNVKKVIKSQEREPEKKGNREKL